MTVCNMSIEAGAKAGLIAPDETTFEYLKGRPNAPQGAAWDEAVESWKQLRTDDGAKWDTEVFIDATTLRPHVSWGTNPGQVLPIDGAVPSPADFDDETTRNTVARALEYMGLEPGTKLRSSRHVLNRPFSNPVRSTRFSQSAGMIWSVSTSLRLSGTPRPVTMRNDFT